MPRLAAVVLLLALPALAAPVPKALVKKGDAELLNGRWASVSLDGGAGPKDDARWWLVIKDGLMSSGNVAPELPAEAPFTLDTAQSPPHLDVTWKGWKAAQQYIYKLDGDTLTLCHAQEKQPRPTEFKGGDGRYCFVYKRVADK